MADDSRDKSMNELKTVEIDNVDTIICEKLHNMFPYKKSRFYFDSRDDLLYGPNLVWEVNPLYSSALVNGVAGSFNGSNSSRVSLFRVLCDEALDSVAKLCEPPLIGRSSLTLGCDMLNDCKNMDCQLFKSIKLKKLNDKMKSISMDGLNLSPFVIGSKEDYVFQNSKLKRYPLSLKSLGHEQICPNVDVHSILKSQQSCLLIDFSKKLQSLGDIEQSISSLVAQIDDFESKEKSELLFNDDLWEFCKEIDELFTNNLESSCNNLPDPDRTKFHRKLSVLSKSDSELNIRHRDSGLKIKSNKLSDKINMSTAHPFVLTVDDCSTTCDKYSKDCDTLSIAESVTRSVSCDDSGKLNLIKIDPKNLNCFGSKSLSSVDRFSSLGGSICSFGTFNSHCYSRYCSQCDLDSSVEVETIRSSAENSEFSCKLSTSPLVNDNESPKQDFGLNELKCCSKSNSFVFNDCSDYLDVDDEKHIKSSSSQLIEVQPIKRRYSYGSDSSDIIAWKKSIFFGALDDSEEDLCVICHKEDNQWFSSSDYEGRVYYFEENSNESSWTLPDNSLYSNINDKSEALSKEKEIVKNSNRSGKTKSMIVDKNEDLSVHHVIPRNWPHLFDGHMCVLREGTLYRTKITDNGKRFRKNWASSYVVLTELFLLFFKDLKAFTAMKNGGQPEISRPEINVDLNGAVIDRGDKISSRKNVYMISTVLGLQVLVQFDGQSQTEQWLESIQSAIQKLPSGIDRCLRILKDTKENSKQEDLSADDPKKISRIGRSKSVKLKNKEGSIEDLSVTSAERQTKIRARLKKFFHRRPTMEALVKKGIWKDEPAFGCYLDQVCGKEHPRVPIFVQRCIQCIESTEENMKTDGLYRASGNLSQVQKIRLQVDQNNLDILDQEEDVHVLTGALKLFFRELKQPLIPFHLFNKAIKASTHHNKKEKLSQFRDIVKNLPTPNHDTLKYLLQHLLRVTKYKEFNRMHIPNLAIVFGPTLMWPEQESVNMALDLMQQNLVIESFLVEFEHIFR